MIDLHSTTEYAWDAQGQLVQITDSRGGKTALQHDARGLLTSVTDCSGQTTRHSYDGHGHPHQTTDALGQVQTQVHNARGQLLALSLPDGSHQSFTYTPGGLLAEHRNALSHATRYGHNVRGQLTWRMDAAQRQVRASYDQAHRLARITTENSGAYEFSYDAADRLIEEKRLDGSRIALEYDADGQVVAVTHHGRPKGRDDDDVGEEGFWGHSRERSKAWEMPPRRTELVRDELGRLIEKRTAHQVLKYAYDKAGQLSEASVWTRVAAERDESPAAGFGSDSAPTEILQHTTRFDYDPAGNLIAEHSINALTGQTHTLRHTHDALGNRTRTELPEVKRKGNTLHRSLNHLHYGSGHLHQINLGLREVALEASGSESPTNALPGEASKPAHNLSASEIVSRLLPQCR